MVKMPWPTLWGNPSVRGKSAYIEDASETRIDFRPPKSAAKMALLVSLAPADILSIGKWLSRRRPASFMDVLGSTKGNPRVGFLARYIQGRLNSALREFLSAICVFLNPSKRLASVSDTIARISRYTERYQHIRSVVPAYARLRCRSNADRAHAKRVLR